MHASPRQRAGFTLIELMIVVEIIGILAAIAIPNFIMFQLRSKTAEAKTNLAAIRTAQEGSFAELERGHALGRQPRLPEASLAARLGLRADRLEARGRGLLPVRL
jgi:prepilin-type N-terminal cleavage/methylation domain-containing protein